MPPPGQPDDPESPDSGLEGTGPESLRSPPTLGTLPSNPPPTPRSTRPDPIELPPPDSAIREQAGKDPDTLISAPRPAERDEFELSERFRLLENRIDDLEERMGRLERRRPPNAEPRAQPWWIWLIFLLGLAVTWRVLEALR